jgi:pimeloyl-ACP methyl ester carboxylesterase
VTPAPLVVLHGANGSAADMRPLLNRLGGPRPVVAFDMLGHGGRDIPDSLSVESLAEDALAECDRRGVAAAHWFGYSVGGLIALWIAAHRPERVLSIATLTTKIVYDAKGVAHAAHLTSAERLLRSNPVRAEALRQMHLPQNWEVLIAVARDMFLSFTDTPPLTRAELAGIAVPALVFGALEDPLVPATEVRALAAALPNAIPALFPGTAHPLDRAPLAAIARTLHAFHSDPARLRRSPQVSLREFRWDRA